MDFHVGGPQRREIKQRRGLPPGAFGYNEGPTSSCHTFCWKARHFFDVPFFYVRRGRQPPTIAAALSASDTATPSHVNLAEASSPVSWITSETSPSLPTSTMARARSPIASSSGAA